MKKFMKRMLIGIPTLIAYLVLASFAIIYSFFQGGSELREEVYGILEGVFDTMILGK